MIFNQNSFTHFDKMKNQMNRNAHRSQSKIKIISRLSNYLISSSFKKKWRRSSIFSSRSRTSIIKKFRVFQFLNRFEYFLSSKDNTLTSQKKFIVLFFIKTSFLLLVVKEFNRALSWKWIDNVFALKVVKMFSFRDRFYLSFQWMRFARQTICQRNERKVLS